MRLPSPTCTANAVATKRVDFSYNAVGQFSTVSRYADLAAGQLVASSTYGYDSAGRLTSLTHGQGATTLVNYAWAYDAMNRLTQTVNSLDGTIDYSYDPTGQLIGAVYSPSNPQSPIPNPSESYSYDSAGNRTNSGYETGAANLLLSDGTFAYTYDAEGNRTGRTRLANAPADDFTTEYAWDYRNRLSAVTFKNNAGTVTKTVTYTYDAFDRLIGKQVDTDNDGTTDRREAYVYDGNQIVLRYEGTEAGALTAADLAHRYLWGPGVDQLLADEQLTPLVEGQGEGFDLSQPGPVVWPLADHLGTIRDLAVFNAQTGETTIANHRVFDSFGNRTSETNAAANCAFGYTGRLFDADTGLQYNHFRWYDPAVGRWLSTDPTGFAAGDTNLNRYIGNDPLNFVDPSGLHKQPTEQTSSGSGTDQPKEPEKPGGEGDGPKGGGGQGEPGVLVVPLPGGPRKGPPEPDLFHLPGEKPGDHKPGGKPKEPRGGQGLGRGFGGFGGGPDGHVGTTETGGDFLAEHFRYNPFASIGIKNRPFGPGFGPIPTGPAAMGGAAAGYTTLAVGVVGINVAGFCAAGKVAPFAATLVRSFGELIKDAAANPRNWYVAKTVIEQSTNIRNKGGISVQEMLCNYATEETIVRHTLLRANGVLFEAPHWRPYWK